MTSGRLPNFGAPRFAYARFACARFAYARFAYARFAYARFAYARFAYRLSSTFVSPTPCVYVLDFVLAVENKVYIRK